MGVDRYDRPLCPSLQPGPPIQTPGVCGPEVLKRERGHVTAETGVAEVGVFRALQPNVPCQLDLRLCPKHICQIFPSLLQESQIE